jgi:hypothetical protein
MIVLAHVREENNNMLIENITNYHIIVELLDLCALGIDKEEYFNTIPVC